MRGVRIYLSGPMTGRPNLNREEFAKAAALLRAGGYEVVSPGELPDALTWEANLRRDIIEVAGCDEVRVLRDWEQSSGARFEVDTARRLKIPVRTVNGSPVHLPDHRPLVALSGYAGSGKDAAGVEFVLRGYARLAFADPLKEVAKALGWNGEKDVAGRALLQGLGVGVRDLVHTDAWVMAAERSMSEMASGVPVVITDCRFPNEASWVKSHGGMVVRVTRPGVQPALGHVSETALDDWPFDATINNDGTLGDLAAKVGALLSGAEQQDT